jgi:tetratricopeptide (TPR) repeat protein
MKANQLAIAADEDYISQCHAQGIYPLAYYPHNIHFLWTSASMAGQSQTAIKASRDLVASIPREQVEKMPFLQVFLVPQYYALVRFGKWDEILKMPAPSYDSPFMRGVWHYARGVALASSGQLAEADKESAALRETLAIPDNRTTLVSNYNSVYDVLRIADAVLAGEIAAKRGDYETAVARLDAAVRFHDALVYTEPDDWHYPVRQSLGAVLLEAGRPAEAEVVYWEDLRRNPENGWSLFGLAKALRAQKKDAEAALVEARFAKAWANADVTLTASRF